MNPRCQKQHAAIIVTDRKSQALITLPVRSQAHSNEPHCDLAGG